MNLLNLIYSFRIRLLIVLAVLLVMTLGVQYYLNLRAQQRTERIIAEQEQALAAGITLAAESIASTKYLVDLYKEHQFPLLEQQAGRVMNVLVIDDEGSMPNHIDGQDRIRDSMDTDYAPAQSPSGTTRYHLLTDFPLPPLVDFDQSAHNRLQQSRSSHPLSQPKAGEPRAVPIPVTTDDGRRYIIVVLGSANVSGTEALWQAAGQLLPTLAVLLLATLAAGFLVWRFTQPISELSEAARRVAAGDFNFRVPAAHRRDEIGALATVFNEMIFGLGRLRQVESQLHQAERSAVVGRLASAIAHEIRNPLNYINLTLDHLRTSLAPEDVKKREVFERLATNLKAEVARINTRISEFLNYSRPAKLELRPLKLRPAVEDALRIVEMQAAENNIEVSIQQQGEIPPVLADAESLRSVLTNLIINSLQAMGGKGGRITVALSSIDNHARVSVIDTGRGIAAEDMARIFEPYFSTKETGTGLGLAIVKKAVDDHGGNIFVHSEPGVGTTFTIELPMAAEARG